MILLDICVKIVYIYSRCIFNLIITIINICKKKTIIIMEFKTCTVSYHIKKSGVKWDNVVKNMVVID
jgi:hypothetical protein